MYLETGLVPARYQINRQALNYLHYILNQPNDSILQRMFNSMVRKPTKGDWAGYAIGLIEKYELNLSLQEIKETGSSLFKKLVKRQTIKIAFKELIERQAKGEKGRQIIYEGLNMADYLLPEAALTVLEKQELFAIRTEMNPNPYNFGNKIQCEKGCQEAQDNAHILNCAKTNLNRNIYKLEDILNGSLNLKIKILKSFQEQIIERNQLRDSVLAVNPL